MKKSVFQIGEPEVSDWLREFPFFIPTLFLFTVEFYMDFCCQLFCALFYWLRLFSVARSMFDSRNFLLSMVSCPQSKNHRQTQQLGANSSPIHVRTVGSSNLVYFI